MYKNRIKKKRKFYFCYELKTLNLNFFFPFKCMSKDFCYFSWNDVVFYNSNVRFPRWSARELKLNHSKTLTLMGSDARDWDEDGYRNSILKEREIQTRTVFRAIFAPSQNPNPDVIVVASSDGTLASYSISSCISQLVNSIPPIPHFHSRLVAQKILW